MAWIKFMGFELTKSDGVFKYTVYQLRMQMSVNDNEGLPV